MNLLIREQLRFKHCFRCICNTNILFSKKMFGKSKVKVGFRQSITDAVLPKRATVIDYEEANRLLKKLEIRFLRKKI